jgi:hypothetical protein
VTLEQTLLAECLTFLGATEAHWAILEEKHRAEHLVVRSRDLRSRIKRVLPKNAEQETG